MADLSRSVYKVMNLWPTPSPINNGMLLFTRVATNVINSWLHNLWKKNPLTKVLSPLHVSTNAWRNAIDLITHFRSQFYKRRTQCARTHSRYNNEFGNCSNCRLLHWFRYDHWLSLLFTLKRSVARRCISMT